MMVNMMAIIFLSVSMQSISALIFLAILSIASLKPFRSQSRLKAGEDRLASPNF